MGLVLLTRHADGDLVTAVARSSELGSPAHGAARRSPLGTPLPALPCGSWPTLPGDASSTTRSLRNTGFGLNLGTQSGYRENVISGNTAGTVTGTGLVNLCNNACNGTATCP